MPYVREAPKQTIWLAYDQEADVLYVNLGDPVPATDSELTDEDVIVRYYEDRVVGYTILRASQRGLFRPPDYA